MDDREGLVKLASRRCTRLACAALIALGVAIATASAPPALAVEATVPELHGPVEDRPAPSADSERWQLWASIEIALRRLVAPWSSGDRFFGFDFPFDSQPCDDCRLRAIVDGPDPVAQDGGGEKRGP